MSVDEPYGHRGHPYTDEVDRSSLVRPRLGTTIVILKQQGFSEREAIAFVAGCAIECCEGETWSQAEQARRTVQRVLEGRAAKHWSLTAIARALDHIAELTGP